MGLCGEDPPDPSKGYAAGIREDLAALPSRRLIDAAAALGIPVDVLLPGSRTPSRFDFTGLGQADYEAQYQDQLAQQLLDLQEDLGPEFVQQRLDELQAADPEGFAMRQRLWDSIKGDLEQARSADRPAARELQDIIMAELAKGGELDPRSAEQVSQRVLGGQVARGNFMGNAAASEEAGALADATEAQRTQRQAEALAFLTSGVSPEDVAYRREQQGLGNLGSFLTGETPTAQFAQLSGAQSGIVPFSPSNQSLPGVNPNAGQQGINFANGVYGANQAWAQNSVNPWMAGLTGAVRGANVGAAWGGGP